MSCNCRRAVFLAVGALLLAAGIVTAGEGAAFDAGPKARTARLIVYRIPTMGNNVITQLFVDDVFVGAIGYGQTYEGFLTAGPHVLSALATPDAKWRDRPPTIIDVRSGQTYEFTVMGNGAGNLMVWNNKDPRPAREGVFSRPVDTAAR